jgi:hypothetical protein
MAASTSQTAMTWMLVLLAAIVLLIIGFSYFPRGELMNRSSSPVPQFSPTIQPQSATDSALISVNFLTNLRNEIVMIQKSLDQNIDEDSLVMEINQLRRRVTNASLTVDSTTQQELDWLDQQLEAIETQARQDTAQALASFEQLANQLEQDIRDDREEEPLN